MYAYVFNRPTAGVDPNGEGFWSIIGGPVGVIVGGALIIATTPVWVTVVGVVIVAVSAIVILDEIVDIVPLARRIVKPIRKPVKRRNRAVDNAIDCAGLGMEDD